MSLKEMFDVSDEDLEFANSLLEEEKFDDVDLSKDESSELFLFQEQEQEQEEVEGISSNNKLSKKRKKMDEIFEPKKRMKTSNFKSNLEVVKDVNLPVSDNILSSHGGEFEQLDLMESDNEDISTYEEEIEKKIQSFFIQVGKFFKLKVDYSKKLKEDVCILDQSFQIDFFLDLPGYRVLCFAAPFQKTGKLKVQTYYDKFVCEDVFLHSCYDSGRDDLNKGGNNSIFVKVAVYDLSTGEEKGNYNCKCIMLKRKVNKTMSTPCRGNTFLKYEKVRARKSMTHRCVELIRKNSDLVREKEELEKKLQNLV